jgi:hypothetical protein
MVFYKLFQKINIRLKVWNNYLSQKSNTKNNKVNESQPSVFFNLFDINQEPYYFPIIFSFHDAGYNIYVGDNVRFVGNSFGPSNFIYKLPRLRIANHPGPETILFVTDNRKVFNSGQKWRKRILLVPEAFQNSKLGQNFLPYPMHPNAYHNRYYIKFEALRNKKRNRKILFSGNTDPVAYQNPVITKRFNKLNRVEVLDTLLNGLSRNELIAIKSKLDMEQIPKDYFSGVLLYLWKWSPEHSQGLEIRVANDEWHDFLASGDFFLCCPGIVIPLSHNAIEAMGVGTIPILQYPEFFHPELKDGINCIAFTNKEDLVKKVRLCLTMDEAQINELRNGVIEYYENWLKHDVACKLIEQLPDGGHEMIFYNEAR